MRYKLVPRESLLKRIISFSIECMALATISYFSAQYGASEAIKPFNVNHSVLVVYQKDADFAWKDVTLP